MNKVAVNDKDTKVELNIEKIGTVMLSWSFMNFERVPNKLREEYICKDYKEKRMDEANAGKRDIKDLMVQRPGIMDSGKHIFESSQTQGGLNVFNQFVQKGYKIVNAWFSQGESQGGRLMKKGHKKYKVCLILSRTGEGIYLDDETVEGLEDLMNSTWAVHVWDNTAVNNGITINYTFLQVGVRCKDNVADLIK